MASQEVGFFKILFMSSLSTKMIRKALFGRDGEHCAYCNAKLSHKTATIDHVIPISQGGSRGSLLNMVLACSNCNNVKTDKDLIEYLRSRKIVFLKPYIKNIGCYRYGQKRNHFPKGKGNEISDDREILCQLNSTQECG
jgi:hypothetical protein